MMPVSQEIEEAFRAEGLDAVKGLRFWHEDIDGRRGSYPLSVTVYDAPRGGYNVRLFGTSKPAAPIDFTLHCATLDMARTVCTHFIESMIP